MGDPLIGKHFSTFIPNEEQGDDPVLQYQGQVISRVKDGVYLVRYTSAITGQLDNKPVMVTLDTMIGWTFYPDPDEWRSWSEQYWAKVRDGRGNKKPKAVA